MNSLQMLLFSKMLIEFSDSNNIFTRQKFFTYLEAVVGEVWEAEIGDYQTYQDTFA